MTYEEMCNKLNRMTHEEVIATWESIKQYHACGSTQDDPEWYGEWISLVYCEMSNREHSYETQELK